MLDKFRKKRNSTSSKSSTNRAVGRIDLDKLSEEQQALVPDAIEEKTGLSFFKGTVEHGYTLEKVDDAHICPRCKADTENQYAHYIYSTQAGTRIMMAPAGYFCVDCPTVIINERIVEEGVSGDYRFQGVVAMSHDGKDFYPFETWNGEKPVYLFDEDQNLLGIASKGDPETRGMVRSKPRKARAKPPRKAQATKKNQRKKGRKRK